jgi:hypothetical protein
MTSYKNTKWLLKIPPILQRKPLFLQTRCIPKVSSIHYYKSFPSTIQQLSKHSRISTVPSASLNYPEPSTAKSKSCKAVAFLTLAF